MGVSSSYFSKDELQEYSDLTYFHYGDIIRLYKKFESLNATSGRNAREARVTANSIMSLPELKYNPFAHRLCAVFSTAKDGTNSMSFDDFIDMMNALSDRASFQLKAAYAFRVFDINDDSFIDEDDVTSIVKLLTCDETGLTDNALMQELCASVMDEADLDGDNKLSFAEFEHVISKSPEFMNSFKIRI